MVYDDNTDEVISKGRFRIFIAELTLEGKTININSIDCLTKYEGEDKSIREKSWVPFEYHNNLMLAYSLNPHIIFYPILDNGECQTIARSKADINWKWGVLRGGTQGLLINDHQYLAFFHSSMFMVTTHSVKNMTHYFMGAYIFESEPPFAITHVSPAPIYGKNFYDGTIYKHYWKPIRAVFPCGYIMNDTNIWITYGRDDHEMWIVKLDKEGLIQSLGAVQ